VYSMLTRMLWCCGLRIGEALDLAVGDVDLGAGVLTVTTAKGRRVRIVPMSQSLADYARGYADRMGLAAQPPEAWFYPSPLGGQYQVDGDSTHIQKIMLEAGVTVDGTRAPRTHDIRHSYAVQALYQMDIGGTDARAGLPVLAAVMGHADIKSTEYYLRLTAHHRPNVDAAMADAYRDVFPEAD
jgi:integrase